MNRINLDDNLLSTPVDVETDENKTIDRSLSEQFQDFQSKYPYQFILLKRSSFILVVVAFILTTTLLVLGVGDTHKKIRTGSSTEPVYGTQISLLGDSLIHLSYIDFALSDKIRSSLKVMNESILFHDEGVNGDTIHDISDRLDSALSHNAAGLIILWDSDVSDYDEADMTSTQVTQYRANYELKLRSVLDRIIADNQTDIIAVSGPGLLGESPLGQKKETMLDVYQAINVKVTNDYNITYIDVRTALQNAIPYYWIFNSGYVTKDGEHFNDRGTLVVAQLFATTIDNWWSSRR